LNKLNQQIETEPENAELYIARSKLYMGAGQASNALSDVQKACALEPGNQLYHQYLDQFNKQ
jgi:predicted Zn-dependent protease